MTQNMQAQRTDKHNATTFTASIARVTKENMQTECMCQDSQMTRGDAQIDAKNLP